MSSTNVLLTNSLGCDTITIMRTKTIADYEKEITIAYINGENDKAHRIEDELYTAYPRHAIGDVPDKDEND